MEQVFYHLTYASLLVLSVGIFTSVSFSALAHILLIAPACHFFYKNFATYKLSKTAWALVGVMITIILSIIANLDILPHPFSNLFKIKYFLIPFFGIFALASIPKSYFTKKRIGILINLFLFATSIASLSGIIAYYSGFNYLKGKPACHYDRACGLYGMYMTYGYGLSFFMVLLTGLLIYRDEVKQWIPTWWLGIAFAINAFGFYLAFARGGWIGYAIALPCFFLKKNKKIIFGLITVAVLFFALSYSFIEPFHRMMHNRGGSNAQRMTFVKTVLVAFKERPVFGWGYKNFEPNVRPLKRKYHIGHKRFSGHAHNNYLEHLASTGIFGFFALVLFSLFWAYENWKRDDLISRLTFPFVISFIASGQFQYTFGDGENLFLIMTVFMISEALSIRVLAKQPLPES